MPFPSSSFRWTWCLFLAAAIACKPTPSESGSSSSSGGAGPSSSAASVSSSGTSLAATSAQGSSATSSSSHAATSGAGSSSGSSSAGTSSAASTGGPMVLYTDVVSGPIDGGEDNLGCYLSIFGRGFGTAADLGTNTRVFIGGAEVANYRVLGNSRVASQLGIQQLTVQVGALEGAAAGAALPVSVRVNGVASNTMDVMGHPIQFTPNPGTLWFVSLSGDDANPGTFALPKRHLQVTGPGETPPGPGRLMGGLYPHLRAGDHVILRGGNWSDVGSDAAWLRFSDAFAQGSPPTGQVGTGWMHFTAYPGPAGANAMEDVHYSTPDCAATGVCGNVLVEGGGAALDGFRGGFQGPWNALVNNQGCDPRTFTGTVGQYISISNLRMDVPGNAEGDAAPINMQVASTGHWRVVNNELGPWVRGNSAVMNAAAVTGGADAVAVLGNHIHDIDGTSELQNHGVYADPTSQNWEVAYNWIHDVTGGSLVQFNDSDSCGTGNTILVDGTTYQGFVGMRVHHNWLENSAKYGVVVGSSSNTPRLRTEFRIWNNVILGTGNAPISLQSMATQFRDATIAFNTLYNSNRGGTAGYACYLLDSSSVFPPSGTVRVHNNILAVGPDTAAGGDAWFLEYNDVTDATGWEFRNNLYWENGHAMNVPGDGTTAGVDSSAISGDPLFTNAVQRDFSLQANSPARGAAAQVLPFSVVDDLFQNPRPTAGAPDVGALQHR